jgi:acetolactate synthase-1/2/3 large subunit
MWMARLYPTYEPNTCLISNGISTMAWPLPGAIAAKLARPAAKVLVATGDGAFLMNSQEIETALRIGTPMVILIWVDGAYGLISWKMDLEIGHNVDTQFGNPDFVAYASFGAKGYSITSADELLPPCARPRRRHRLRHRLPGRLSTNSALIASLGELDESLSWRVADRSAAPECARRGLSEPRSPLQCRPPRRAVRGP